jgi:hypothetical protein
MRRAAKQPFFAIFEGMAFFLLENRQGMAIFLDNPAGPGH